MQKIVLTFFMIISLVIISSAQTVENLIWPVSPNGETEWHPPIIGLDGIIYHFDRLVDLDGSTNPPTLIWEVESALEDSVQNNEDIAEPDDALELETDESFNQQQQMGLFPNPIKIGEIMTLTNVLFEGLVNVSIFNISGEECYKFTATSNVNNQLQISVNEKLAPGLYIIQAGPVSRRVYIQ